MLIFSAFGYVFAKLYFSVALFSIGFILGRDLEKYFVDSIKGLGGSLKVFFTRPIGWVIWVLIFISIGWAVFDELRTVKKGKTAKIRWRPNNGLL